MSAVYEERERIVDALYAKDHAEHLRLAASFLGVDDDGEGTRNERRIRLVRGSLPHIDALLANGEFERPHGMVHTILELLDVADRARPVASPF